MYKVKQILKMSPIFKEIQWKVTLALGFIPTLKDNMTLFSHFYFLFHNQYVFRFIDFFKNIHSSLKNARRWWVQATVSKINTDQ